MRKEKKIGERDAETEETCHLQDLVHLHFNRTNRTLIVELRSFQITVRSSIKLT